MTESAPGKVQREQLAGVWTEQGRSKTGNEKEEGDQGGQNPWFPCRVTDRWLGRGGRYTWEPAKSSNKWFPYRQAARSSQPSIMGIAMFLKFLAKKSFLPLWIPNKEELLSYKLEWKDAGRWASTSSPPILGDPFSGDYWELWDS